MSTNERGELDSSTNTKNSATLMSSYHIASSTTESFHSGAPGFRESNTIKGMCFRSNTLSHTNNGQWRKCVVISSKGVWNSDPQWHYPIYIVGMTS